RCRDKYPEVEPFSLEKFRAEENAPPTKDGRIQQAWNGPAHRAFRKKADSGEGFRGRRLRAALEHIRDDGMDARMCMVMARTALLDDDRMSREIQPRQAAHDQSRAIRGQENLGILQP